MTPRHRLRALRLVAASAIALSACGGSTPASPSRPSGAAVSIVGLTATVEKLTTTPSPGLLYRLTYQIHETAGGAGATLQSQRIVLSDGTVGNSGFSGNPHVIAAGTITVESTLSLYPATVAAAHLTFSVEYVDDGGRTGTATAEADIPPLLP